MSNKEQILDNLRQWSALLNLKGYSQYSKLSYNLYTDQKVRELLQRNGTVRMALFSDNIIKNKSKAFEIATHLINVGIQPESVKILTMDQCLDAMWAKPESEFNKNSLFDKKNQLLIIIDCYVVSEETNHLKAAQFREAFSNYCKSNPHINIIIASSDERLTTNNCIFNLDIDRTKKYSFFVVQNKREGKNK